MLEAAGGAGRHFALPIVGSRRLVQPFVAVPSGLACQQALFRGIWVAKLLGACTAAGCVRSDETSRLTFGGSLVQNARFGDLTHDFWRDSCTKRLLPLLHKKCPQKCPTRVSYKSAALVSHKSVHLVSRFAIWLVRS